VTGDTGDRRADAELFIAELLPPARASGKLFGCVGGTPRWNNARYDIQEGRMERAFSYPAQIGVALDFLLANPERDSYICTGLAHKNRQDGSLKEIWSLHTDWDGDVANTPACVEKVVDLGGFAIESGTAGHLQCFVPLADPIITSSAFTLLCKAFQTQLPPGCDPAKHKWNDFVRIPGTFNLKSTVRPA
jgi:hypothetical protein